jgi:transposase
VRVTTALNRLLALPGARVTDVKITVEGVVVRVALRRRRLVCSACGQVYGGMHDRAFRRWRHLDLAGRRCYLEYELRRVACRDCGVRVEAVPWARAGARHTRDFEDLAAFCAQQMAKSQVQALLRIAWDTVGRIVQRVVADHLDERRLDGLVSIGCDELSYRRGQRYLTNVADHRSGRIVWSSPGRNARTLQEFFDHLGERKDSIRAVSIDMSGGYEKAVRAALPAAQIAFDPFHVVALAGRAVDDVRRAEWNAKGKSRTPAGKWLKNVRWALRKAPENLTDRQRAALATVQQTNAQLYRAYLLKEQLRALYHLDDPAQAPAHLAAWLAWASRSKLAPFIRLARTLRRYRDGILAAIELGLTNARLEGLHSKVRLLSHRSFGFHSAAPLIALIYLCCAGITINPPLR